MSELETNYEEFKTAMAQFDRPLSLFITHTMEFFRLITLNSDPIQPRWRVTVVGDNDFSAAGEHKDFAVALAILIKKIREAPEKCRICGGRMDGACRHVHSAGGQ